MCSETIWQRSSPVGKSLPVASITLAMTRTTFVQRFTNCGKNCFLNLWTIHKSLCPICQLAKNLYHAD